MRSPHIVLASTSPYRRELLSRLSLPFETADPGIDETIQRGESPEDAALRLSQAKARAVADRFPSALVIGSDQVAYRDNELFGKPEAHDKAVEQLRALRGRTIRFYTGLCLLNAKTGRSHLAGVGTDVTFRELSEQEIEEYLHKERPYNCAGSAKSEGLGIALISRMVGEDPNALIGLPLIALCDMLRLEGINPLTSS